MAWQCLQYIYKIKKWLFCLPEDMKLGDTFVTAPHGPGVAMRIGDGWASVDQGLIRSACSRRKPDQLLSVCEKQGAIDLACRGCAHLLLVCIQICSVLLICLCTAGCLSLKPAAKLFTIL